MQKNSDFSALKPLFWGAVLLVLIALFLGLRPDANRSVEGAVFVSGEAAQ